MTPPLPEPVHHIMSDEQCIGYMSVEQMKEYGKACRAAALEEAAQVCSHKAETKRLFLNEAHYVECAEAIRRVM